MSEFIDPFPDFSQVVDIGGEKYVMGSQKPIELGFKSRQDFLNAFGREPHTEYLIRKYMFYSLADKKRLQFDPPEEKAELIKILKRRAAQLQTSKEFTSSALKNTLIQRSYLNIQKLIQELEGADGRDEGGLGLSLPKLPEISLPCTKAKQYISSIPDDRLFQLVLEIAWYLLHPNDVPKSVQCSWASAIKQLDTLRLGDIYSKIKDAESAQGITSELKPMNYFKKINLEQITKAASIKNALDKAKEMALEIEDENSSELMKKRLETLLDILTIKKYLNNDIQVDPERIKIIDAPETAEKIKRQMIANPMKGGKGGDGGAVSKAIDKPLGEAMMPLFEYFRVAFEPIYSMLESSIDQFKAKNNVGQGTIKTIIIPQLTTLLHICNNLNPVAISEATGGQNTYGVYRITHIDKELVSFINGMLKMTFGYVDKFTDNKDKYTFNKQLFKLPKVRLSSLIDRDMSGYKDSDTIPYIQFLSVGENIVLPTEDKKDEITEPVYNALHDFFNTGDLYILCTDSDTISENIPIKMYEINFSEVNVGTTGLKINNLVDNYFNKIKDQELFLDKLTTLTPYVVFNDAELALSIFIAFKELMPK